MIGNAQPSRGTRKLFALFVAICLLLSLMPVSGFGFAENMDAPVASDSAESVPADGETQSDSSKGDDVAATDENAERSGDDDAASDGAGPSDKAAMAAPESESAAASDGGIGLLAGEIAYLTGSVTTTPVDPLSGASFKMVIELNSNSAGGSTTEGLRDTKVSFKIPANVEIQSLPTTNGQYTVEPANPQPGDTVTVSYKNEISVGSLQKLECWFRFPAGVSLPSESFQPEIKLEASNAYSHTMTPDEVNPTNLPLGTVMQVTPQDINPIFLHTAEIDLMREAHLGGLNQNGASVKIEFPGDAEVLSVVYKGVEYAVVDDGAGGKVATVPIGTLNVGNQATKEKITVLYSYPPMTSPGTTDYEIKATYTATRFDGTPIAETGFINETVSHQNGGSDANAFFMKHATYQVFRTGGQALTFELDYTPYADMRDATLTDDPIRAGEADFFDAVEYRTVTWTPYAILDPVNGQTVRTQMLYQTSANPGTWQSAGEPSAVGQISVEGLALDPGDYVTQVQFKFFGSNGSEVPAGSSPVKIRILSTTTDAITTSGTSYDDNKLTNGAYMTGEIRFPGNSSYVSIEDEGVKNARTAETNVVANNPQVGIAGHENPLSPNPIIPGEELTYSIRHFIYNSVLRDATSYLIVDPNIEILDVALDDRFPDATWSVTKASNGYQLVKVEWNGDITSAWTQYGISLKGIAKPGIGSNAYFRYLVASDDPTQQYTNGGEATNWWLNVLPADWAIIDAIPGQSYGATFRQGYPVDNGLGMNPLKLASTDGTDYALTQAVDTSSAPKTGYYSLDITNPESTNLEEVRVIDMLPTLGDVMALSDNAKKSTVALQVDGMTLADGSALPSSCELYYSEDATPATNRIELTDFSALSGATWIPWDGMSSLPPTAKAVKLVKTDGLLATESFGMRMQVTLPQNDGGSTLVAWNTMSAGGKHAGGYIVPGEPHKSGFYLSENGATEKLAGILWEDTDGNDLRDAGEPVFSNKAVRLYDWDDSLVAQTTTDVDGRYEFTGLLPERYRVEVDMPANLELSDHRVGSDKSVDNDFVRSDTYRASATVNLATETNPLNIDGGFYAKASVGDYVWEDVNENGLQESHEPGFAGAKVTLYRMVDGSPVQAGSMTTGDGGRYAFTGLKPGTYKVAVDALDDYVPAAHAVGGSGAENDSKLKDSWDTEEFALESGDARTDVDAGLVRALDGTVKLVKVDENGDPLAEATFGIWADGANTETDQPLKTVESGSDGAVEFADMPAGSYIVKETEAPYGYELDGAEYPADIVSNSQLLVDLGEIENVLSLGSIALTKTDGEGTPLAGATFGIWDGADDPEADDPLDTAESGSDGSVVFADMPQGSYLVREIAAPDGYVMTDEAFAVELDRSTLSFAIGQVENQKEEVVDPDPDPDPDPEDPSAPTDSGDPSNPSNGKKPASGAASATGDGVAAAVGILVAVALAGALVAALALGRKAHRR